MRPAATAMLLLAAVLSLWLFGAEAVRALIDLLNAVGDLADDAAAAIASSHT